MKNAISYSDEGSTINISAETCGSTVVIQFENEGTIPQEMLGLNISGLDQYRSDFKGIFGSIIVNEVFD